MLKFAKVKFPNSCKLYDYICELEDIKKADRVYVPTREGAKIVEVCGIFYADLSEMPLPAYRYKKLWGKVPERILIEKPKQSCEPQVAKCVQVEKSKQNFKPQAAKRIQTEKPKQSFGPLGKKKKVKKAATAEDSASVSQDDKIEDKPEQNSYTYAGSYDEIIKEQEKKLMVEEIFIMLGINLVTFLLFYKFTRIFR